MNKIFSIDSGFTKFMTKVADVIILNMLVMICSLGVVTTGPALVAMYYVLLKEVRDEEGAVVKSFFKSFKQNFIQGVLLFIIIAALGLFFSYDIYVVYKWLETEGTMTAKIVLGVVICVTVMLAIGALYSFPMLAKFYNTTFKIFKNSVIMAVVNLPQTMVIVIITAATGVLIYLNPYLLVFAIGAYGYLTSMCYVKVFDKYIPKEEPKEAEEEEEETMHIRLTMEDMQNDISRIVSAKEENSQQSEE